MKESILIIILSIIFVQTTLASDFWTVKSGSTYSLVIEGIIANGDFVKFEKLIKKHKADISSVYIFSPGGDFEEAIKIGNAVKKLELSTVVPMSMDDSPHCTYDSYLFVAPKDKSNCICASACFFIHIAGQHRRGNYIAVHRPYFSKGKFGKLSESESKVKFDNLQKMATKYMNEMSVPKKIQEDLLATPSDKILILSDQLIKMYFWGDQPARYEWVKNKCSELEKSELDFLAKYNSKVGSLNDVELKEYQSISKKQDKEIDCKINVQVDLRHEAFEKYFKIKRLNNIEINFSVWENSWNLVGKSFDEINEKNEFKESEIAIYKNEKMPQLLRKSLDSAVPTITIVNDMGVERKATKVDLFLVASESKAYFETLNKIFIKKWGKPTQSSNKWNDKVKVNNWFINNKKIKASLYFSGDKNGSISLTFEKSYVN